MRIEPRLRAGLVAALFVTTAVAPALADLAPPPVTKPVVVAQKDNGKGGKERREDAKERREDAKERREDAKERREDAKERREDAKERREDAQERREERREDGAGPTDEQRAERKKQRESRRAEAREKAKAKWGDELKKPPVREELRRHARRMARLARIKEIATEKKNEARVKKADELMERERARHQKRMEQLTSKGGEAK
jgi:hypothetical protein